LTQRTTVDALHVGANNVVAPYYKIDGYVPTVPSISMDSLVEAVGNTMRVHNAAIWLAFHLEDGAMCITAKVNDA
jgi:hypothetical protein